MSTRFWNSLEENEYIEPKRDFLGVGIVDFLQPFLIQSMDKPGFSTIGNKTYKVVNHNGAVITKNHYTSDYRLDDVRITVLDAHDLKPWDTVNASRTLYSLLTSGGYTYESSFYERVPLSQLCGELAFPNMIILELAPEFKKKSKAQVLTNIAFSAIGGLMSGEGLGSALDATYFASPLVLGIWTLYEPIITSVRFGTMNYASDAMTKIDLKIAYNNFKYEQAIV